MKSKADRGAEYIEANVMTELRARIEELEQIIGRTYTEHLGRDYMHLPLNDAVGKRIEELMTANANRGAERNANINRQLADKLREARAEIADTRKRTASEIVQYITEQGKLLSSTDIDEITTRYGIGGNGDNR